MGAFCVAGVRHRRRERRASQEEAVGEVVRAWPTWCAATRELQAFLVANALWELALAALKTFVVLYVTKTLGLSLAGSSLAVGVAATVVLVGALVSGKLGDSLGRARVMRVALVVYGLGLIVPFVSTVPWVVALAAPLVAFGGGVTMSLPYALLMPMMPRGAHGAVTGLYSLSRGVGTSLGRCWPAWPSRRRAATTAGRGSVCGAAILVSIPAMAPLRDERPTDWPVSQ